AYGGDRSVALRAVVSRFREFLSDFQPISSSIRQNCALLCRIVPWTCENVLRCATLQEWIRDHEIADAQAMLEILTINYRALSLQGCRYYQRIVPAKAVSSAQS